jgi:hypothetical protein
MRAEEPAGLMKLLENAWHLGYGDSLFLMELLDDSRHIH